MKVTALWSALTVAILSLAVGCTGPTPEERAAAAAQDLRDAKKAKKAEQYFLETRDTPSYTALSGLATNSHADPAARGRAARLLGERKQGLSSLRMAVKDAEPGVAVPSAAALVKFGDPMVIHELDAVAAATTDATIKSAATEASTALRKTAFEHYVDKAISTERTEESVWALRAAGRFATEQHIPRLVALYDQAINPILKKEVVYILADLPGEVVDAFMRDKLTAESSGVRSAALYAVQERKDVKAAPILEDMAKNDPSISLRGVAARVAKRLSGT